MSGKQAKAKRKTAKKAAEVSASASARPRVDFIIDNVRCFAGEQRVPIRPLTLLVGENSTGKTTFMACLYTALNLLVPSRKSIAGNGVNFNTLPFSLGGFRDIARRQVGGKPAADEFGVGLFVSGPDKNDSGSMMFSFGEKDMETVMSKMSFAFSDGKKLEIVWEKSGATVSGPGFRVRDIKLPSGAPFTLALGLLFLAVGEKAKGAQANMAKKARLFLKERLGISGEDFMPEKFSDTMREGAEMMSRQFAMAFNPSRPKPKRTYSVLDDSSDPEDEETPKFLFRFSTNSPEKWRELRKRLVAFGKDSGMFSDFNVVGHGPRSGGDFHLEVKTRGVKSNIADVGYGVSQVYPLLVPVMYASQWKNPMIFMLQEPEVHLHPQAQAALTQFFAKSAAEPGRGFIIETHGDGIIDRVRICVSNGVIPPEEVVILYFEPNKKTGEVKIHPIRLDKNANLLDVPAGYRDFFVKEDDLLLGFKKLPKGKPRVHHR